MAKQNWSGWVIIFLLIFSTLYGVYLDKWGKNEIIVQDVISYYAYLPGGILFRDLNFGFLQNPPEGFDGTIWLSEAPLGKPVLRMTMGLALLWIPFFLAAHLAAHILGETTWGYSWPYALSLFVAALFYLWAGLYYVRKILLRYFPDWIVAGVLLILVSSTNLLHFVVAEPGVTHVYSFALVSAFLWFSIRWTEKPEFRDSAILGILAGLIVVIRPVNITVLVFPALIGITSFRGFIDRMVAYRKHILLAALFAFLMGLPQMLYWKAQTGHFLFNSYLDQGKFYFDNPQIINGLFSFRKGWLIYTPVMFFSLAGLFFIRNQANELLLPIVLVLVLNIYIIFSWWCWWYGGGYGMRTMIDSYGFLAVPFAAILYRISKIRWMTLATLAVLFALTGLNQFQMIQYRSSLLHWDSMTGKAYKAIFLKRRWPPDYLDLISIPDYTKALHGEKEYNPK